ncbi:MAG TPA: molybdate ABC transporter substrate-binding protein [Phycisphaerales bacterium]|nr:molybdate ABC transporter substrate-binding protein [Phycisphaerales bacterium]
MSKRSFSWEGLFFVLLIILFSSGCSRQSQSRTTTIFCAASLGDFLQEILAQEELDYTLQVGGSLTLINQMKAGAEADILVLADAELSEQLDPDLIQDRKNFAGNRLVLVQPKNFSKTSNEPRLALADPQTAPLGRYSQQALKSRPVPGQRQFLKDATAVLASVALAHSELGIIYQSDAQKDDRVKILKQLPTESHSPILYQAVLMKTEKPGAERIYALLTSPRAEKALTRMGFIAPLNQ